MQQFLLAMDDKRHCAAVEVRPEVDDAIRGGYQTDLDRLYVAVDFDCAGRFRQLTVLAMTCVREEK